MNAIPQPFPSVEADSNVSTADIEAQLLPILDAIKIINLGRFQIGNRPEISLPAIAPSDTARPVTSRLSDALWPAIYDAAYARPFSMDPPAPASAEDGTELLGNLRAAFPEGSRWSGNWQVYKTEANGVVHVRKGDCCRQVSPGTYAVASPGPVQVNTPVSILLPMASSLQQPGFYHITGNTPHCDHDDAALGRLYFNSRPASVVSLMAKIAAVLNSYAIPFRAKTLLQPAAYDRTDSTVFYLARRHLGFALSLLRDICADAAPDLGPDVPLFSKSLIGGIGAADDPGYGMSFGQTRAMLMADAIVSAWADGNQTAQLRFQRLSNRFTASGLSLAAPHLNAGNSDIYVFPA